MEKHIFREKSVERVSSPEQLDAYLKVTSPSVWIILVAIIILLAGFLCWGIVGTIDTTQPTSCYIKDGELTCYTIEETANKIEIGTIIKLDGLDQRYSIYSIDFIGQLSESEANIAHAINAQIQDYYYELKAKCDLPDNSRLKNGKIVIESISPIEFVFN